MWILLGMREITNKFGVLKTENSHTYNQLLLI
jgi:hypothetical protein